MKIALVSDAWAPQVNGVVTTLVELVRGLAAAGHEVEVVHPCLFRTRPCPGYPGIDLAVGARRQVAEMLARIAPDAIHIATEGPLGWAARRYCLRAGLAFTTAFHTRFPEMANAAARIPVGWGYALLRHFHRPSSGVMVPTRGVLAMLEQRGFRNLRPWTHGVDTGLFRFERVPAKYVPLAHVPRPIALYVGRISYEKNIPAFLEMRFSGSKVVCGVGPLERQLRERYPDVHWFGLLPREELARLYGCADVLVFPSRNETFGLVMLEAMACGTPVAAFPVDGPLELLASPQDDPLRGPGGAMHEDLWLACQAALTTRRRDARERALEFPWARAAGLFLDHLVPARGADRRHETVTVGGNTVTESSRS